mgnify:CR=1 FL=1
MNRSSRLSDEVPEDRFGEAISGLAVAGGVGRDGGKPAIESELLEPIDGVVAGVVVGEDLGEEQPQGNPRGVDAGPPPVLAATAHLLDEVAREDVQEGEPVLLLEPVADGIDLVAGGWRGRL